MSYTNQNEHNIVYGQIPFTNKYKLSEHMHQQQIDENIIHVNKYRFIDFYYEELDKLDMKYYQKPDNNQYVVTDVSKEKIEQPLPINIPHSLPVSIPNQNNIRRYRLDSLNNHLSNTPLQTPSSTPSPSINQSLQGYQPNITNTGGLDLSMSPPLTNSRSSNISNQQNSYQPGIDTHENTNSNLNPNTIINNSSTTYGYNHTSTYPHINMDSSAKNINNYNSLMNALLVKTEYYIPSISHQTIIKRVYDNYLCLNIDHVIPNIQHAKQYAAHHQQHSNLSTGNTANMHEMQNIQNTITATHDFISDQCDFLVELITGHDPFKLFNHSTIGLLFDRMHRSDFTFQMAHLEICKITAELTNRVGHNRLIKQTLLDSAIGILNNTTEQLLQPGIAVASILIKSLGEFISWIYNNYSSYWMNEYQIQASLNIARSLYIKFGVQIVDDIYKTIKKYFIPSYLFSVSRACWKFTNIHKREISKLRSLIIPQDYKNQWIIKCIDQIRADIAWVFPDSPNIKNLIVFIDGRNCFYADEYQKTTGGINLELLRRFLNLQEYNNILADLVYGRITNLMTCGRQLIIHDTRYVIPVIIFNERHRQQIQPLVPPNRTVIYTPRGQDDDLMTLYLWLSNPGTFIASNDNYGNYAARLTQSQGNQCMNGSLLKYYEGLWSELIRCFKLVNPISDIRAKNSMNPVLNFQPGTSAPF